jgi:hypothetical protein
LMTTMILMVGIWMMTSTIISKTVTTTIIANTIRMIIINTPAVLTAGGVPNFVPFQSEGYETRKYQNSLICRCRASTPLTAPEVLTVIA